MGRSVLRGSVVAMYKEFDMRGVGKASALSKVGFGGSTDTYRWTQTMNFVDIFIPLPPHVQKASQLVVKYTRDTLLVSIKGKKPIIDGASLARCAWMTARGR